MTNLSIKHYFAICSVLLVACAVPNQPDDQQKPSPPQRQDFPELSLAAQDAHLIFFVETQSRDPLQSIPIPWRRSQPREAWVERNPAFDPMPHLDRVEVVTEADGNCRVVLQLNERGAHLLDISTGDHKGHRLFLMAFFRSKEGKAFDQKRCVGIYSVRQNNPTGLVAFTPDSTRDEALSLVAGLNKTRKSFR